MKLESSFGSNRDHELGVFSSILMFPSVLIALLLSGRRNLGFNKSGSRNFLAEMFGRLFWQSQL